jgi:hypothetical protein
LYSRKNKITHNAIRRLLKTNQNQLLLNIQGKMKWLLP